MKCGSIVCGTALAGSLLVGSGTGALAQPCSNPMVAQPLLDLLPFEDATHVAVLSGSWFNSATWADGLVPTDGARVYIPAGVAVEYGRVDSTRLDVVRVDGVLRFQTGRNSRMFVDTLITAPGSIFTIGEPIAPLPAQFTSEIIFLDNGPIDTTWDPRQLSRGFVPHGTVRIVGADKTDFVALAQPALAGDDVLILDQTPVGWNVGDTIVVAGTTTDPNGSHDDNSKFRDEVLTIAEITGNTVRFQNTDIPVPPRNVLRFDHAAPTGYEEFGPEVRVANLTRNITLRSENPDAPVGERGHVMIMHSADVDIRHTAFVDLGRSDKSRLVDEPGTNVDGSPGNGTNQRGRYALHLHRNLPQDNSAVQGGCQPARIIGNAIWGSPGWGLVHHDSFAGIEDNVVFDVLGAGIVAESGNEIGWWTNNLVIKTTGDDDPSVTFEGSPRVPLFDFGFNGEGYWVQGSPQIDMVDNTASSNAGAGMAIFTNIDFNVNRDREFIPRDHLPAENRYIVTNAMGLIDQTNAPLASLIGLEVSNAEFGLIFWNHMRNDDGTLGFNCPCDSNAHRERTRVEDFALWNIHGEGIFSQYSTQIDFIDGLILGNPADPIPFVVGINGEGRGHGVGSNEPTQNLLFRDVRIEGWARGMKLPREGFGFGPVASAASRIISCDFANNIAHLSRKPRVSGNPFEFPMYLEFRNNGFDFPGPDIAPVADFVATPVGGQGVVAFDAGSSFDPDPMPELELSGNAIAAYAWDFDADGLTDAFGRDAVFAFPSAGEHPVTLSVWDSQGRRTVETRTVVVPSTAPDAPLTDAGFDPGTQVRNDTEITSVDADRGWIGLGVALKNDPTLGDALSFASDSIASPGVGQVIRDQTMRRGSHELRFDLRSEDAIGSSDNRLTVRVWGIAGEFFGFSAGAPVQPLGVIPLESELVAEHIIEPGSEGDVARMQLPVDLRDGFDTLYLQLFARNVNADDELVIDNIELVGTTSAFGCSIADIQDPRGEIDFFDIQTFLNLFSTEDPAADLNEDSVFDFFDVLIYLDAFSLGCP